MDAPCKIQGSIHVFRLVNNMCPGKWVHINAKGFYYTRKLITVIKYIKLLYLCALGYVILYEISLKY